MKRTCPRRPRETVGGMTDREVPQEEVAVPVECEACRALIPSVDVAKNGHKRWHEQQDKQIKDLHRLIANVEKGNPRRYMGGPHR